MIEVKLEVAIGRPAGEVFAFLTAIGNFKKWQEGIVAVEQIDAGPWRPGTRIKTIHSFLIWNNLQDHSEIMDIETDRRISNRGQVGKTVYREEFLLSPEGNGTLLRYRAEIEPGGVFAYLKTISEWNFRSQMRRSFAKLKSLMETAQSVPLVPDAGVL
jgi:hypothetical protein